MSGGRRSPPSKAIRSRRLQGAREKIGGRKGGVREEAGKKR